MPRVITSKIPIEAIGTFPDDWSISTLSESCALVTDGTHDSPKPSERGYHLVTGRCITDGRIDFSRSYLISEQDHNLVIARSHPEFGDILFANIGNSIGDLARVETTLSFSIKNVALFKPSKLLDSHFLKYYLLSHNVQNFVRSSTIGSAQPFIGLGTLRNFPIALPPIDEQRTIGHILGTLDDKIELNRRVNETLEGIAQALFQSWFVDFDPVRAKAEGREPTGMDAETAALFPDSFEESALGGIPSGWKVKMLSDLCSTQYGFTASAASEKVGPKFLRVMDINKQDWITWSSVPYCQISDNKSKMYALQLGDIVVARMADPGKSAIIDSEVDAVFASYLVRLKCASLADSYYTYYFLKSDLYQRYSQGAKSGSVQSNMNAKVIVGAWLAYPPSEILDAFLRLALPIRQRIAANVRESDTLSGIRDTLLPKLLSGELRVPDAERLSAEVV